MKKKMLCFFAAVLFGMLFLCSCGGGEDYALTASADRFWYEGYVYSMNTHGILTYRKTTEAEEIPLCFDPLCEHFMEDCPAFASGADKEMAVARNRDGEICIYYTDQVYHFENMSEDVWPVKYRLCCINVQTGEKTVILSEQSDKIYQFFLYGNDIYLQMQGYIENAEGKRVSKSFLRKMPLDGGELVQLSTADVDINKVLAVAEVKGRTVIYWEDYYDNLSLYVSSEDFSENTKLFEGMSSYGRFVSGDYLYYAMASTEVLPEVEVKAPDDDLCPTPGATYTVYPKAKLAAYYRLNITDPEAAPELMYDGVSSVYSSVAKMMWANGDKIYVIPYDPVYFEVLDAYAVIDYVCTEKQPHRIPIRYQYINARSGMKILEIDLTTGEQREILTPGLDPVEILDGTDDKVVVKGLVVETDRIRDRIEEKGIAVGQETYMFWEIQEIPLNP